MKKFIVWAAALALLAAVGCKQDSSKADKPVEQAKTEKTDTVAATMSLPATDVDTVAEIAQKPEPKVITTKSGLKYIEYAVGTGLEAGPGKKILVHYTGWLDENGKKGKQFDSSIGGDPFPVTLGATPQEVIDGWEEGLSGMKAGGKRELIVPPNLAYGKRGYPGYIPPDATLIFEVEMVKVSE